MTKMKYISILVFMVLMVSVQAQPIRSIPYETMIETAELALEKDDYYNALHWYEKAYDEKRDKDVAARIANLGYLLRDYERSEKNLERLLKRDRNNLYQDFRIEYAMALKAQGKYDQALNEFNKFIEYAEDEDEIALAKHELKGIEMMDSYEQNIDAVIQYAGKKINFGQSEYSPSIYRDGTLFFTSFGEHKEIEFDNHGAKAYARIYAARKNDKGNYEKADPLPDHINREGYHTTNVSFSLDGKRMFFTRAILESNKVTESRIMVSFKNDEEWSPAIEVEGINGDYEIKQAVVGELFGSEVLYFVSNMDGGTGGYDIYYATKIDDTEYSTPVNLGEKINTEKDDVTPYYSDGTLYFSSDGHPGMGGLDIFYSTWDGSRWSDPANIGFSYNTSYDDLYLRFSDDGGKGFLVSNRPLKEKRRLKSRTCCDDIFTVEIRETVIDLLALVTGADKPLDKATIVLKDLSVVEMEPGSKTNFTGNDFNFLLESDHKYKAIVTRDGYYPDSVEFNTFGILDDYTVKRTIDLKPIPREPEIEIVTINQTIRLNNIYYDFDDDKILLDAEKDLRVLQGLMEQYPDMIIELSSHTDSRGVSTYNQKLSQRRAESATQWLIDKGVASDRIKPVGYGEAQILNGCVNGVRCDEDQHQINRRTEFKIIAGPESIEIKREVIKDQKKN